MAWGRSLFEMTAAEAKEAFAKTQIAVIPTGSCEQHGPHLPIGTDSMAGIAFGKVVAEKMGAILVPFSVVGISPYHMAWKGTLTLRTSTFVDYFVDICGCLYEHGIRDIVVTNGHEGNVPPLRVAGDEAQRKYEGLRIVVADTYMVLSQMYPELVSTHAGAMETIEVMCYDPSLAHVEWAANPTPFEIANDAHEWYRRKDVWPIIKDVREVAYTGWYGSIEGANPERAAEVLDKATDLIVEMARGMLKAVRTVRG